MSDVAGFAVHDLGRAYHLAAKRLPDGLVPEADTQDRYTTREFLNHFEADSGFARRLGSW